MSRSDLSGGSDLGDELDLDARQLCVDGGCTGVIGADGRCKVCGRPGAESVAEGVAHDPATANPDPPAAEFRALDGGEDAAFDERQLCPDGACVGLLGPDGSCKVCGQRDSS